MNVFFAGSGSKGNATLFLSKGTLIQIDAGISKKRIFGGIKVWNKHIPDIQAVFITHNHSDHIKDLAFLTRGETSIYASEGSLDLEANLLEDGEGIEVGPFIILPFSSHHDAPNPKNFILMCEGLKIGYVTDTGFVDEVALGLLEGCDYYVFESNYEPKMLEESSRPRWLKDRIRGKHGHLSNLDCCRYLGKVISPKTKGIFLAHLSEECNAPEVALTRCKAMLKKKHRTDIVLKALPQHEGLMEELVA